MHTRTLLPLFFLLSHWPLVIASRPHLHHLPSNGLLSTREVSINSSDYPAQTIQIPIDHYNASDTRTYSNRYWVNASYYRPGGPVFYFDSGEQNAHPLVPYFLAEAAGPSAVMTLARRFNGLAVLFEHRFYGDLHEGEELMVLVQERRGHAQIDISELVNPTAIDSYVASSDDFAPAM